MNSDGIQDTPKLSWWNRLAHPGQFVSWTRPLIWPLVALTAALFALGLWFAFFNSPADYQMGDTVRIMETRPLAKTVNWRVTDVVERAK